MSIHNLPQNPDIELIRFLLQKYLRPPSGIVYGNGLDQPPTAVEFTPDLSAPEIATLSNVAQRYNDAKGDYDQYESYRSSLKAFLGNATPTNAEVLSALKLTIRIILFVVDALVRKSL